MKTASPPKEGKEQPCLLTEFPGTRLEGLFASRSWGRKLALAFAAGAALVLLLGHFGRANALNRQIQAKMHLASGDQVLEPVNLIGGYLAQANHGFFFLVVVPLFVLASARFIESAGEAIEKLRSENRLSGPALQKIGAENRFVFKYLWWFLPVLLIAYGLWTELVSYCDVRQGASQQTGYVQAPFLPNWQTNFQTYRWQLLTDVKETEAEDVERHVKYALQSASTNTIKLWYSHRALVFSDLTNALPELWPELTRKGAFKLDLGRACTARLLHLDAKLGPYPAEGSQRTRHLIFVVAVQLLEGTFQGFAAWVALKAIFWILAIWRLLPKPGQRGELVVLPTDPRKHFGLADLNEPYNRVVVLLTVGAFAIPLEILSGQPRGGAGDISVGVQAFMSPFLIMLAVGSAALVLGAGPILLFNRRLEHLRDQKLASLNADLGKNMTDQARLELIEKQRELVEQQTCWPKEDSTFKRLIFAIILFTVLPVCLHFQYIPHEVENYLSVVRGCDQFCKKITDLIYHVTRI